MYAYNQLKSEEDFDRFIKKMEEMLKGECKKINKKARLPESQYENALRNRLLKMGICDESCSQLTTHGRDLLEYHHLSFIAKKCRIPSNLYLSWLFSCIIGIFSSLVAMYIWTYK